MFRARERGMSFWPFAVSLLALIVLLVMWFSATSERDQARLDAVKAESARKAAETAQQEAVAKYVEASKFMGFRSGGNLSSKDEIERALKEYGPKLRDIMTSEYPTGRYQAAPDGPTTKEEGPVTKVMYLSDPELADAPDLQSFLTKFETAAKRMKLDLERSFAATEASAKDREAAAKAAEETMRNKDKVAADLRAEKAQAASQAQEKETELNDKVAQLTAQRDAKDTELETLRKQMGDNETKLVAKLNEATGTIKTLVQRDAPVVSEGPDGEVVVADNGVAIVNRGRSQWLMPGTIFDVWGLAKGGQKYAKGKIKVTSVDDETARAVVLEEVNARDPITKGDLIQSLTYSPNRQLHFVLVGDFKKMGRSQAEAVLKKLGAVVESKVTAETNYVVVGAGDNLEESEAVKAAKDLNIRQITEEQLASFARY